MEVKGIHDNSTIIQVTLHERSSKFCRCRIRCVLSCLVKVCRQADDVSCVCIGVLGKSCMRRTRERVCEKIRDRDG
jgi:hypothetical protein